MSGVALNNMTQSSLQIGARIGVVDDEPEALAEAEYVVKRAGYVPVPINLRRNASIDDVVDQIASDCDAALCDHRLNGKFHVPFYGAQLASTLNEGLHIPTVLRSTFATADYSTTIRRWRHNIPRVLDKSVGSGQAELAEAFASTIAELAGQWSLEREPCSAALEIVGIDPAAGKLEVIVGAWRPGVAVVVPLSLMTETLGSQQVEVGQWLSATVNCHARYEYDLYFHGFKALADPPAGWMGL